MGRKHTHDELNKCSHGELVTMVIAMQDQMDALNENIERLIEQVRAANSYRFGRHTDSSPFLMRQMPYMTIGRQNLLRRKSCHPDHTERRPDARGKLT